MASYKVLFTEDASRDLQSITTYVARYDNPQNAEYVLDQLLKLADSLVHFPERGSYPKELIQLGIKTYREVFFKSYSLIYRVIKNKVHIYIVVDGRRDLQSLLTMRCLNML